MNRELNHNRDCIDNMSKLATHWLLNSKIHNIDAQDAKLFGSFNNYLDINKRSCEYAYTEITGYSVELLLDLYRKSKDPIYLEQAKLAGNWIIDMQYAGTIKDGVGGYLYSVDLNNRLTSNEEYSFDAGICLGGLSDLYRATQNSIYLNSAAKSASWLVQVMQNPDGSFKSLCSTEEKNPGAVNQKKSCSKSIRKSWFYMNGCHHGKIAIGLLKYYSISKEPSLLKNVLSLCDWLMEQQTESGYFRIAVGSDVSFSHTHSYAVEGLLYASAAFKNSALFGSAKLGGDWLIRLQKSNGCIPAWTNDGRSINYTDISAVAQAIRIWCVLYSETQDSKYFDAIDKSNRYLSKMQNNSPDVATSGGFYLAELDLKLAKHKLSRLYSWATIFAIHALELTRDLSNRKVTGDELW